MKFIDEFRDPALARRLVAQIRQEAKRPVRLMEFCGGHTHAIFNFGLRELLAPNVDLRSGPGCPVCVTAAADLNYAIALAEVPDVILTTFGDMVRVPGSAGTLQDARARGADVRIVYSPLDTLAIARQNPKKQVAFLGVGFETTAPAIAATVRQADTEGLPNFSVLSLHKLTPPAMRAILDAGEVALDGIIGPGHVSAVIGSRAWEFLPRDYAMPCAVAGFEPLDILGAIAALVRAVGSAASAQSDVPPTSGGDGRGGKPREAHKASVINTYSRSVRPEGNPTAQRMMRQVFEIKPAAWRGFGTIPASGLALRPAFASYNAALRFELDVPPTKAPPGCRCGEVLRGVIAPPACALFGRVCTPRSPVGPCMVSAEGACAAYYKYAA